MSYKEIEGDLIKLALEGHFDVIAHGTNCFSAMASGLAPQMAETFGCDKFPLEGEKYKGSINKLAALDWKNYFADDDISFKVVNAYTQYEPGPNASCPAIVIALRKMNKIFQGKRVGLPQIGCGVGGLDWKIVQKIIKDEMKDCEVIIVNFKSKLDEQESIKE